MSTQVEPNPEKVGFIVGELVKVFQEKSCNTAEMGLIALYVLQVMQQFGVDFKQAYPKTMTIQSAGNYEITYKVTKMLRNAPNLLDPTQLPGGKVAQ